VTQTRHYVIGLLGGIGSGKSTVAKIFEELGAAVVDADEITAKCLALEEVVAGIREAFGNQVVDQTGHIDRQALAERIFSDETERQKLHALIHPEIIARMRRLLDETRRKHAGWLIVIDAPLLLESQFRASCHDLILVRALRASRIERVVSTRGWDAAEVDKRESFQTPLEVKEAAATRCIDNDGSPTDLEKAVRSVYAALEAEHGVEKRS